MAHRKRIQIVMSEPQVIKGEPYITNSGQVKRRRYWNPNSVPVK